MAETIVNIEDNRKGPLISINTNERTVSAGSIRIRLDSRELEKILSSDNEYTVSAPSTSKENIQLGHFLENDVRALQENQKTDFITHDGKTNKIDAKLNFNFSDEISKLCASSPSTEVIAPALLLYRESPATGIRESLIPVTGSDISKYSETEPFKRWDISEDSARHLFCGSLYADIPVPTVWTENQGSKCTREDRSQESKASKISQYDAFENTFISWQSEGTEKLLAEKGFMNETACNKYKWPLSSYSEIEVQRSSTRKSLRDTEKYLHMPVDDFQIPYFDLQREIDTVFSCLDEKKEQTESKKYTHKRKKKRSVKFGENIENRKSKKCHDINESKPLTTKKRKSIRNAKCIGSNYCRENVPKIKKLTKTSGPRKKTGCWTCRLRRKKCSEEKPSCRECIRLGLKCEGYMKERPAFMRDPVLARRMKEEIKKVTLAQKKRGSKQKYERELKIEQSFPFQSCDNILERQKM